MALDPDWVILRPLVVLGGPVFGASALIRGLAALPVLPVMPETGPLQGVALEDVAETVGFFVPPDRPARLALELAGPERLSFAQVVALHRAWLGWRPARPVALPGWAAGLLYRAGDLAGRLGRRPPLRSTARAEIRHGAVGDPAPWTQLTGIRPRGLEDALRARPATVQERWFARLYPIKPVLFVVLVLFWTLTAIISLTTGFENGLELMHRALAGPGVVAGALAWHLGHGLGEHRIVLPLLLYLLTGAFGLPVVWMQMQMRDLAVAALHRGGRCRRAVFGCSGPGSPSAFRPLPPCRASSG